MKIVRRTASPPHSSRRYAHGANAASDNPIAWYEGAAFGGTNERFMRPDWQGSIALVTDNAGSTVYGVNTYDEYGIPGSANAGRFQYTGQAWIAELGMYYYKARMYSPTLGRFMQTDPIGYKDQINLYEYAGDDPVDGTDPTGLAKQQSTDSACETFDKKTAGGSCWEASSGDSGQPPKPDPNRNQTQSSSSRSGIGHNSGVTLGEVSKGLELADNIQGTAEVATVASGTSSAALRGATEIGGRFIGPASVGVAFVQYRKGEITLSQFRSVVLMSGISLSGPVGAAIGPVHFLSTNLVEKGFPAMHSIASRINQAGFRIFSSIFGPIIRPLAEREQDMICSAGGC